MPVTTAKKQQEKFCRVYDLTKGQLSSKQPFAHQVEALNCLRSWFTAKQSDPTGGILVLPTGGGKTVTAWHFLCANPLSKGYKVLWLAHTHHLLEQAFYSLESEVGLIASSRKKLQVRVVSGTIGHFGPGEIRADDDVLICTLQTVTNAYKNKHPKLEAFIKSAGDKLCVVFDEAHHSPAPSYCRFLEALRSRCTNMHLLGLTATPTYTNEGRVGWLNKLFPQGILYQAKVQDLMGNKVLAQPIFEQAPTAIQPDFDQQKYQQWVRDYHDLPEDIITKLAQNSHRNNFIAQTYVDNQHKYGKTIIFADRWFQCEAIKEALVKLGEKAGKPVRVDVVYSHIDADPGSAEARNTQIEDSNKRALRKFKNNEIDVLINIRMLTEGTDVPDVQTVFLTRQTTSRILLTQMVGRALRGPNAGGTDSAYVVSFVDDWQHVIDWADWQLEEGAANVEAPGGGHPPIHLISIDLVQRLIRQMDSGVNINSEPFLNFIPIGWYKVEFETLAESKENSEVVQRLIMVFEREKQGYEKFIHFLQSLPLSELKTFQEPDCQFESQTEQLDLWQQKFFSKEEHIGKMLMTNLFYITRHIAQNNKQTPSWFEFKQRNAHDLDELAQDLRTQRMTDDEKNERVRQEYTRGDRFWQAIYQNYNYFWSQYSACLARTLGLVPPKPPESRYEGTSPPNRDVSEEVKEEIKRRDKARCLCCGNLNSLEIDHIEPKNNGINHSESNLQTLCRTCNQKKDTQKIDFRNHCTELKEVPNIGFVKLKTLSSQEGTDIKRLQQFLQREINFFYCCSAVKSIEFSKQEHRAQAWKIDLYEGNNPQWLREYIEPLLAHVHKGQDSSRAKKPYRIKITSPNLLSLLVCS